MTGPAPLQDDATLSRRGLRDDVEAIRRHLGQRSIVLVGLMGAGKTTIGRRLAHYLAIPFVDADAEIELAAGKSISEIFADHGETLFRDGERRVIARLLAEGPKVLATGGGAFMNAQTRAIIAEKAVSVWLKADLDLLVQRTAGRSHRPLLNRGNPREILKGLIAVRYPVYGLADVHVRSRHGLTHEQMARHIIAALEDHGARTGRGALEGMT
jgi:shikimate kinase